MIQTPPYFWASFLTFFAFCILCSLGFWQVQRAEWKNGLLEEYAKIRSQDPTLINTLEDWLYKPINQPRRITLKGKFDFSKEIFVGPRTLQGKIGFHIYTPFKIISGGSNRNNSALHQEHYILINRGWSASPDTTYQTAYSTRSKKPSLITLTGIIQTPPKKNYFTPANNIEGAEWYFVDLQEIEKAKNLYELMPNILYLENKFTRPKTKQHPVDFMPKNNLNNNHMGYAFFWFSLALSLCVIYYLRVLRKN